MKRRSVSLAAFIAAIIATNTLTAALGPVTWLGATATAGTWVAGLTFVARDALQDHGGSRWVLAGIVAGATLSTLMSPTLALASGATFLLSETLDWTVYTPLRNRGKVRAALASNIVGAVVDTLLFLALAGFPLGMAPTQVVVKVAVSTLAVTVVSLAVSRQPMRVAGRGRHA